MTIARSRPKLSPAVTFKLFLELDCLLDLIKLHIYQSVVLVSLGMNISKDLLRFLEPSFRNEPSWRLGNRPGPRSAYIPDFRSLIQSHQINTS